MQLVNQICTKRITISRNAIAFVMLIGFSVSCYEPNGPTCPREKDYFNSMAREIGIETCTQSAKGCDTGFTKLINSTGGDSLILLGIGSTTCLGYYSVGLYLNNIKSTGEYEFGAKIVPGEPSVVCYWSHTYGVNGFHGCTTDANMQGSGVAGSGLVTIDNLSSDFISGTFHATCNANPVVTEITSGSFSLSLAN